MSKERSFQGKNCVISDFRLIVDLSRKEISEITKFCLDFLIPPNLQNALNAAYILGDIVNYPQDFEISILRTSSEIKAVLLHRDEIFVPLGGIQNVFWLLHEKLNSGRFFIRISSNWNTKFEKEFAYSDKINNIAFWMNEKSSFRPQKPPSELTIRLASSKEDILALANYYGNRNPNSFLKTSKTHARVMGFLDNEIIISVARSNSVGEGFTVLGGVHTLKEFRGKGYSTAVVSFWTAEVLRRELLPILETDEDNVPALSIYEGLGYSKIGMTSFYENGVSIIDRLRSRV